MDQPWKCPACGLWLAPNVREHRCDDTGLGTPARIPYVPVAPMTLQRCYRCGAQFWGAHACWCYYPGSSPSWGVVSGGTTVTTIGPSTGSLYHIAVDRMTARGALTMPESDGL